MFMQKFKSDQTIIKRLLLISVNLIGRNLHRKIFLPNKSLRMTVPQSVTSRNLFS